MEKKYDVIIVGGGPGGIYSAYELKKLTPEKQVAVFEEGHPLEKRRCPIDGEKIKSCVKCKTCSIMDGERTQEVEIFLKHIGKMEIEDAPTSPLTAEVIAAEAERKKKRAYHRQYYREKVKPKREARKAAAQ